MFGGLSPIERRRLRRQADGRTPAETARAYLDGELGTARREPKPRPVAPTVDDDTKAAIVELYRAGMTQVELAERYGRAQSLISRIVVAAGVSRGRPYFVAS